MSDSLDSFLATLSKFSNDQIQQAGPRYTPGIHPDAPNLPIQSLNTTMDNVACGEGARARFHSVLEEFSHAWERSRYYSQRSQSIQQQVGKLHAFLSPMLNRLRERDATAGEEWAAHIASIESDLIADVEHWSAEEAKLTRENRNTGYSSTLNEVRGKLNAIGSCLTILRDEKAYIQSSAFKVLFDPFLLVRGEWGTGKTHLVCDYTQKRLTQDRSTVLVLAKTFHDSTVEDICSRIDTKSTVQEIFNQLEELASETKERTVIILDGINEGVRNNWQNIITDIKNSVSDRPNIGLIITCRTPFESIAVKASDLETFYQITHIGFDVHVFDAQAAFFEYYKLPLSEVPILDKEFSRPLTLKLICQSLQNLSKRELKHRFAGIASGQKGMTYILESFVNSVGKAIECQFGLRHKGCWELLKGNDQISDEKTAGFAPCMGEQGRDFVRRTEVDRIVAANYPNFKPAERKKLVDTLRINGLVDEDAIPKMSKTGFKVQVVFRLPYQKFSDHLIVRYLLKKYLNTSTDETIKQSFVGKSPLAIVFRVSNHYYKRYANPGWAEAVIAEFPERVKTRLKKEKRELFFLLPTRAQNLDAYFHPFIGGLFWREPSAFTEGTQMIVNHYLNTGSEAWERMIDVLVAVSTKPNHPYHAHRLYDFLARFTMPDRDLKWSEYLRQKDLSLTMRRLLTWAEKFNDVKVTEQSARELVILLSLVLTTVVRKDRDLVTKMLVLIGERYPELLFSHAETTLAFNDPYVPERMLAAAYGTTMSLVDSDALSTFRPVLGGMANTLYQKMFSQNANCTTHHSLMRDYALGIIEIAGRVNCFELPDDQLDCLAAPFTNMLSSFVSDGTPDPAVKDCIEGAIRMDFETYTIGGLVPIRADYNNNQPTHLQFLTKIERRIFDLGYRSERFKDAEAAIGYTTRWTHDHEKVDRYGKKYSWIAFFEMWGEIESKNKRPYWRGTERSPDCDIDPSFPKRTPQWTPPLPELFGETANKTEDWVNGNFTPDWTSLLVVPEINGHQGEWILLEGFVLGTDEIHDRELFAFIRGAFIARKDLDSLRSRFLTVQYPGNDQIPPGFTDSYLYAGEAGRSRNFARDLYQKNGKYNRQKENAFDRYEHKPGIPIEIPYIGYGWESHHSPINDFLEFNFPAPSLIQRLHLARKNREINFYDAKGNIGTLYQSAGNNWNEDSYRLLYIRADLLRLYLTETRQVLIWCNWGERGWLNKENRLKTNQDSARLRNHRAYVHIHRSFLQWSHTDGRVVQFD